MQLIESGNFTGAELLLKQIVKNTTKNSEALKYLAIIAIKRGDQRGALEIIVRAIEGDKRNSILHCIKGDIQQNLGIFNESIESYLQAIKYNPMHEHAFNNLGNAYQLAGNNLNAIECYNKAISLDSTNPEFFCNLGNALWKLERLEDAKKCYQTAVSIAPTHWNSLQNLAHLALRDLNFRAGWDWHESRWFTGNSDQPPYIKTSKPRWDGLPKVGRLLIWAEQGIGDQILYSSMLHDLAEYPQSLIVSIDKKLLSIFRRSFPLIQFIDKESNFSEELYDEHIPMGSLGGILRPNITSFKKAKYPYLITDGILNSKSNHAIKCGISWKSKAEKLGMEKSIPLIDMSKFLTIKNINFINLQYGEVSDEISVINSQIGVKIQTMKDIDLYDDIEGVMRVLDECSIVVTTSNTTAHLAGALGKETLLLLPRGNARFWYWHDIDGVSLWYPSIKVFKQGNPGDWSAPIEAVKAYLEKRFEV